MPPMAAAVLALATVTAWPAEHPCADPEYRHGISYLARLRYGPDFAHFAYTNPDAPKGRTMRVAKMGTFDNYNGVVEIGRHRTMRASVGFRAPRVEPVVVR